MKVGGHVTPAGLPLQFPTILALLLRTRGIIAPFVARITFFYFLNSLFRKIVFPVPRNRIPCSTESYSLFRAKKFPVNLTGNWPENA
jgi:hypothetical protein